MRIVLDTNCLVNVIMPKSFNNEIWQAFRMNKYTLCVSNVITIDPDDNKFVDCAIIAGATYIVSNDHHFSELEHYDFPKVEVRTLSEFLGIVKDL